MKVQNHELCVASIELEDIKSSVNSIRRNRIDMA